MAINGNAVIIHIRRQQGIGTCDIEAVYNATVIIGYGIDKFRLTEQTVIGQWRLAIPMPVFQSCPERVQSAVIVSRIDIAQTLPVIKHPAIFIKQTLNFQNLLQFVYRSHRPVMLPGVSAITLR
ncbi:hypothetical protein EVA_11948 [gut metagenome]|uniref:Uncharacterized protein n=1 Tax=gut metagenome TaxID=749906 RepID=J9FY84_9ZZZZ